MVGVISGRRRVAGARPRLPGEQSAAGVVVVAVVESVSVVEVMVAVAVVLVPVGVVVVVLVARMEVGRE